jgi:hypothetical protein
MDSPAQSLDQELKVALRRFHRLRWMLTGMIALIIAVAVAAGAVILYSQHSQLTRDQAQLTRDNTRLLSSCDFYRPLTVAPVTVNPATRRPAPLSVAIIAASREAYAGQGCPGPVPPPDPSLLRWAAYYHVHVQR